MGDRRGVGGPTSIQCDDADLLQVRAAIPEARAVLAHRTPDESREPGPFRGSLPHCQSVLFSSFRGGQRGLIPARGWLLRAARPAGRWSAGR